MRLETSGIPSGRESSLHRGRYGHGKKNNTRNILHRRMQYRLKLDANDDNNNNHNDSNNYFFKEKNVFVKRQIMSGETILDTCTHTHAQAYVHTNILTIHNLIYTLNNHNSEFIERFRRLKTLYNLHTNM